MSDTIDVVLVFSRLSVIAAGLVLAAGCSDLVVQPFSGTNMLLDLRAAGVTAAGQHLEIWGRDANDDILRIGYRLAPGQPEQYGFIIRTAVSLDDPCMINGTGYRITDPRAYSGNVVAGGVVQTPEQQAGQITLRIRHLTAVSAGGLQTSSLLLTMPWDDTPLPAIAADAGPDERRAACQAYWNSSPFAYTGAPLTPSQPIHGATMGPVNYTTAQPQQTYNSIDLVSLYDLGDLQEIWLTVESQPPATVDPLHRGPVYLQGYRVERGRYSINFDLAGDGPVSGSMLLILPARP
jgi:hypothetical protein